MNIMKLNVRDYFSSSSPKEKDMQESSIEQNPNSKQEKETYRHWGLRMCAIANGSRQTLVPYLHSVYQHIYNEQSRNQEVQDVLYGKLQTQIKAYMTKRDLKSLVLPLFTIVLGKNFSMTKNLLSLRLSSHH